MLNPEQELAVTAIVDHCRPRTAADRGNPFFILEGPAGTGKTYCMKETVQRVKRRTVFTAPTNKAVRVLRDTLKSDDYRPECRTIYSLLGLTMSANGEVKELTKPEEEADLSAYSIVVVDEAGMLNEAMRGYIAEAAANHPTIRWVFMGDRWQLPPVGEDLSWIWREPQRAELTQVMRTDNQILTLATYIRQMIPKPFAKLDLRNDNDDTEGVWAYSYASWQQALVNDAEAFATGLTKAIAWRNASVDAINRLVRKELFEESIARPWQVGDRATLLEPAKDAVENEIVGVTDEEGKIERVDFADHPVYPEFKCWRIVLRSDTNASITLWVLDPKEKSKYEVRVARYAAEARSDRKLWRKFWEFKEAFHQLRHAYATTAHRAQGSTYDRAYVNWRDIMVNPNLTEARRCLYVAVSRPKKELYLG